MADCMYHGQSGAGPCGLCAIEREQRKQPGELGGYGIGNWTSEESDVAAGLRPIRSTKPTKKVTKKRKRR